MATIDEILKEMNGIFARVLDSPSVVVTEASTANDVDGWDSLSHALILAEVEKHFGTKFSIRDVVRFQNVGDICRAVQAKLNSQSGPT